MKKVDLSLMYVTDHRIVNDKLFLKILEETIKGGATVIQLREKKLDTLPFINRALKVKKICHKYKIPFIINDRLDVVLAVNADGIHIGQKDIPYSIARKILGKNKIIGLSVSTLDQLDISNQLDIDYIGLSPIFPTKTKSKNLNSPLGINGLINFKKKSNKKVVSIGGIDENNIRDIIINGSDGAALISTISKSLNPLVTVQKIKNLINKYKQYYNDSKKIL